MILWDVFGKLKTYALALAAIALAVLSAFAIGRRRGQRQQQAADQAATDHAVRQQQETTHAVEIEVDKLPDAPPQGMGEAKPGTAAGELRGRWLRDPPDRKS